MATNCAKNTMVSGQVGTLATQAWSGFPRVILVQVTLFDSNVRRTWGKQ